MSDDLKDIVVQLRRGCDANDPNDVVRFELLAEEAADQIALLRKDIEDLRHDLERHMTALAQAEEYRHKLEPQ